MKARSQIPGVDIPATREHVHKACASQNLLTSVTVLEDDGTLGEVNFAIPRAHWVVSRSGASTGLVPPLLGYELVRQAATALGHIGMGLPLDTVFSLESIEFTWTDNAVFPKFGAFTGVVHVDVILRGKRSGTFMFTVFDDGGTLVGTGKGLSTWLGRGVYNRLRTDAPTAMPRRGGQLFRTEPDGSVTLDWDDRDPFFFDHASDHVPGMLFVAAAFELQPDARTAAVSFEKYAELDSDIKIAHTDGRIDFVQRGVPVASAVMKSRAVRA